MAALLRGRVLPPGGQARRGASRPGGQTVGSMPIRLTHLARAAGAGHASARVEAGRGSRPASGIPRHDRRPGHLRARLSAGGGVSTGLVWLVLSQEIERRRSISCDGVKQAVTRRVTASGAGQRVEGPGRAAFLLVLVQLVAREAPDTAGRDAQPGRLRLLVEANVRVVGVPADEASDRLFNGPVRARPTLPCALPDALQQRGPEPDGHVRRALCFTHARNGRCAAAVHHTATVRIGSDDPRSSGLLLSQEIVRRRTISWDGVKRSRDAARHR